MKVIVWCADKFRYYIVFSKSILFILGLIFSYKLVEKAFFDILITYLPDERDVYHLRKAAIVVNLQGGTHAVVQIFFAFIADAYTGLFKMVVCSTTLCIIGLSLLFSATRNHTDSPDLGVFYPVLVLVTLSHAAKKVTLKSFLCDQLVPRDRPATEEEEERAQKRSKFWWNAVSFLAAIVALFGTSQTDSFRDLSMVLAIATGAAFLWFLLGIKLYTRIKPTGSPLSNVLFVIYSAIIKRDVEYPQTPERLFENSSQLVQILPQVSWLRWLDKAAIVLQGQENPGHVCTVEQVKGVKFLLKMLPMWTTFLTFSLVAASGSTFFIEEATSITDDDFHILSVVILQRFTEFMVAEISDYVLEKLGKKKNNIGQRAMLVRIGTGMICCVLCCLVAWTNALHRLLLVRIHGNPKPYMSVFRLIPQFLLLALMEGLAKDGLENFFDSQVSRSISRYGPPFGECVMGVGNFLSAACILILSRRFEWFNNDVNSSCLDKYYRMLAILSCVNIIVYCLVAHWYGDEMFLSEDEVDIEMANSVEADVQPDSVGPPVLRSLSGKRQYSRRSFSGRVVPIQEESSFGDNLTENTNSQQDGSLPFSKLETGQETTSSCSNVFPDNRRDDHEAETPKPDLVDSTDQVSLLVSESAIDGSSGAPILGAARSFSRVSSRGLQKRFHSMH